MVGIYLTFLMYEIYVRYIQLMSTLIVMNARNTTTHNPPHYNPNSFRQVSSTIFTLSQQNFLYLGGGGGDTCLDVMKMLAITGER